MAVTELEYLRRAEGSREKLYRAAFMTLGSEAAAIDAVDEAVYRGYRKVHTPAKAGIPGDLAHAHSHQRLPR